MNKTDKTQFYLSEVTALFESGREDFVFELKRKLNNETKDVFFISMISLILNEGRLDELKKQLTVDEIQSFNQSIDHKIEINGESLKKISMELKKLLLFSKPQMSEEAVIKLEKMSVVQLKNFLETIPSLSSFCLSLVSAPKLTLFLNELSQEELDKFLDKDGKGEYDASQLEKEVLAFEIENESPFAKALCSNIKSLSIDKEKKIYEQLFAQNKIQLIKQAAYQSIPSELIQKLPKEQLRESLSGVGPESHSLFLSLLEVEEKNEWISIICDEGSKLSTMLEMEIKSIQENSDLFEKNQSKSNEIKLNYYKRIREYFSSASMRDLVLPIVEEWVEQNKR